MAEKNKIIQIPTVLHLPSPDNITVDGYALNGYYQFLVKVVDEVPSLYKLTDEDRQSFLPPEELARLTACEKAIKEWLQNCALGNDIVSLGYYPYHAPYDAEGDLRKIIKRIAEKKSEFAEKEQLRKKRIKALEEMGVRLEDAQKYLSGDEYQRFIRSLPGAADAFIDAGRDCALGDWRLDDRALRYFLLNDLIEKRRKEDNLRQQARVEYNKEFDSIFISIQKFHDALATSKRPEFGYPKSLAEYQPHSWCGLEQPTGVQAWALINVLGKVPDKLKSVVTIDSSWEWIELPRCKYCVSGVPSLTWYFKRKILIKSEVSLKKATLTPAFYGYEYQIHLMAEKFGSVYLGPVEWGEREGFTTPISLLSMLGRGLVEAPGIKVVDRIPPFTTYSVQGFTGGTVKIHDNFREFIIANSYNGNYVKGLVSLGVIDEVIANLIKTKKKLKPEDEDISDLPDNDEVIETLLDMGYKKPAVKKALNKTDLSGCVSLEDKIKKTIANMAQ